MSMPIHRTVPWLPEEMILVGPYQAANKWRAYHLYYQVDLDGTIGDIFLPGGGRTTVERLRKQGLPVTPPRLPRRTG